MDPLPPPLAFFLLLFSGWVNRHQQAVIDYLLEECRRRILTCRAPKVRAIEFGRRQRDLCGEVVAAGGSTDTQQRRYR